MKRSLTAFRLGACLVSAWMATTAGARAADPVGECIAANERSLDLRDKGKLLDARSQLALCAASACPDAIQHACRGRMAELNAAIPSIVFDVKDALGRDLADVKVSVDGKPSGTNGVTAIALDPGPHAFRFEAADQVPFEKTLVVREGEGETHQVIVLGEAPPQVSSGVAPRKWLGVMVGGAGVALLGGAGVLALVAKSSYDGASGCAGTQCTDRSGYDTTNSARDLGNVATALLVVGGVATAGGMVLWLTAPSTAKASASRSRTPFLDVGLTARGASLRVRF